MGEALALSVQNQLGIVDEGHPEGLGKLLSADTDEVDVGTLFENQAGSLNGVAEVLDAGHATSFHATTVHEKCVELNATVGGKKAATTSVEGRVIFEDGDGGFDSIEGRSTPRKKGVAGFKRVTDTGFMSGRHVSGDGPRATVN
jgi:hypothetical protein